LNTKFYRKQLRKDAVKAAKQALLEKAEIISPTSKDGGSKDGDSKDGGSKSSSRAGSKLGSSPKLSPKDKKSKSPNIGPRSPRVSFKYDSPKSTYEGTPWSSPRTQNLRSPKPGDPLVPKPPSDPVTMASPRSLKASSFVL